MLLHFQNFLVLVASIGSLTLQANSQTQQEYPRIQVLAVGFQSQQQTSVAIAVAEAVGDLFSKWISPLIHKPPLGQWKIEIAQEDSPQNSNSIFMTMRLTHLSSNPPATLEYRHQLSHPHRLDNLQPLAFELYVAAKSRMRPPDYTYEKFIAQYPQAFPLSK